MPTPAKPTTKRPAKSLKSKPKAADRDKAAASSSIDVLSENGFLHVRKFGDHVVPVLQHVKWDGRAQNAYEALLEMAELGRQAANLSARLFELHALTCALKLDMKATQPVFEARFRIPMPTHQAAMRFINQALDAGVEL